MLWGSQKIQDIYCILYIVVGVYTLPRYHFYLHLLLFLTISVFPLHLTVLLSADSNESTDQHETCLQTDVAMMSMMLLDGLSFPIQLIDFRTKFGWGNLGCVK